jgi:hypothetical protein
MGRRFSSIKIKQFQPTETHGYRDIFLKKERKKLKIKTSGEEEKGSGYKSISIRFQTQQSSNNFSFHNREKPNKTKTPNSFQNEKIMKKDCFHAVHSSTTDTPFKGGKKRRKKETFF